MFISEATLFIETDDENVWFIDLGSYAHMSSKKEWFNEYHERICWTHIYLGDNRSYDVQGYGLISVKLPSGLLKQIYNVMYVPSTEKNLTYVSTINYNDFWKWNLVIISSILKIIEIIIGLLLQVPELEVCIRWMWTWEVIKHWHPLQWWLEKFDIKGMGTSTIMI